MSTATTDCTPRADLTPRVLPADLAQRLCTPAQTAAADPIPAFLDAVLHLVAEDGPDLSLRQLAMLLILATEPGPHTVRGLAARLKVKKPAITRGMDRLAELGLAERLENRLDLRSPHLVAAPDGCGVAIALRRRLLAGAGA